MVALTHPLFLTRTVDGMAPHLIVVFRRLVRLGRLPACCRQANITPIPKGPPSSSVDKLRTDFYNISIVKGVSAPGVGSSWTNYGTTWRASNHPVFLSEKPGYL